MLVWNLAYNLGQGHFSSLKTLWDKSLDGGFGPFNLCYEAANEEHIVCFTHSYIVCCNCNSIIMNSFQNLVWYAICFKSALLHMFYSHWKKIYRVKGEESNFVKSGWDVSS